MILMEKDMKCEFCNTETFNKHVKKQHWYNGDLYIIENVEAEVCPECGERYYHARILDKIDKILSQEHEVKENLNVEVVRL